MLCVQTWKEPAEATKHLVHPKVEIRNTKLYVPHRFYRGCVFSLHVRGVISRGPAHNVHQSWEVHNHRQISRAPAACNTLEDPFHADKHGARTIALHWSTRTVDPPAPALPRLPWETTATILQRPADTALPGAWYSSCTRNTEMPRVHPTKQLRQTLQSSTRNRLPGC